MADALLQVTDLTMIYPGAPVGARPAVSGLDLHVERGSTTAIVGESGCGKSTLARSILGAITPTAGSILFDGTELVGLRGRRRDPMRRRMGFVQQNPSTSLDPRMLVADVIAEPLRTHTRLSRRERLRAVEQLAERVSLRPAVLRQRPRELSGGQAQRVAIARAIALSPELVVLDEPTSALDLTVQAQILNLLLDLQADLGLTYLLISHDLEVVEHVSDDISVMYLGQIVERGRGTSLRTTARHPYTAALFSATPAVDPAARRERIVLRGDVRAASATGCAFRSRCWLWPALGEPDDCRDLDPQTVPTPLAGVACHHPLEQKAESA